MYYIITNCVTFAWLPQSQKVKINVFLFTICCRLPPREGPIPSENFKNVDLRPFEAIRVTIPNLHIFRILHYCATAWWWRLCNVCIQFSGPNILIQDGFEIKRWKKEKELSVECVHILKTTGAQWNKKDPKSGRFPGFIIFSNVDVEIITFCFYYLLYSKTILKYNSILFFNLIFGYNWPQAALCLFTGMKTCHF